MLSSGLTIAADQNGIIGFQEDDPIRASEVLDLGHRLSEAFQIFVTSYVNYESKFIDGKALAALTFDKRADEFRKDHRREIIDTKIPLVLQYVCRLALSGAGHAGKNDQIHVFPPAVS